MSATEIRDAATVIIVRNPQDRPSVLMGRRGSRAAFMPNKFVFPGGAVDPSDRLIRLDGSLSPLCEERLRIESDDVEPGHLAAAAIRETWEETGLILGRAGHWPDPPEPWRDFAGTGHAPSAKAMSFVFRAVTPPGRPRRFDARFFVVDAGSVASDLDHLPSDGELSDLRWIPIDEAQRLDLPFVTEVALAEVASRLPDLGPPPDVPFFRNDDEAREMSRLGGRSPLAV